MNFFKKNRGRAAVFLCIIILLSIFAGTLRSVNALENKVRREYTKSDRFGETVKQTVESLALHTRLFAEGYEAAAGADELSSQLKELSQQAAKAEDPVLDLQGVTQIRSISVAMYDKLASKSLLQGDVTVPYTAIDNDISILKKYEDYNGAASKYNQAAQNLICRLLGKTAAPVFG